jgi:hypothetical protein
MSEELHGKGLHATGLKHDQLCSRVIKEVNGGLTTQEIYSFVFDNFEKYAQFTV